MSVLARNRGVSAMEFLNSAHELELFTIRRSAHDIPKAYTFVLRVPLCESARRINQNLVYANSIYPTSKEDYAKRRGFQRMAILECENMLELLRLTSEVLPIKDTILEPWTGYILSVEKLTKLWFKSDKERFKGFAL